MTDPTAPNDARLKKEALALLREAAVQRSKVFLLFKDRDSAVKELRCQLLDADDKGVALETESVQRPGDWVGQNVACFFRLIRKARRLEEVFYNFGATIRRADRHGVAGARLILDAPGRVDVGQRRGSLRVAPDLERFPHVFLWTYDSRGGFNLKQPVLTRARFENGRAKMIDLSAGGMRLGLSESVLEETRLAPEKGLRLILLLRVRGEGRIPDSEHWLIARVNNALPRPEAKDRVLGLEFVAHGKTDVKGGKVRWRKVEDHFIQELSDITYRWHLAKSRNVPG